MSSSRYLLVDGHSVIFQWPELLRLHQKNTAKARQSLIKLLNHLHDTSEWSITLVFDGKKGGKPVQTPGKMVILYAHSDQTADSIIEHLVARTPRPERITVITADNLECQTVESLGAFCHSPEWLQDELRSSDSEWRQHLEKVHRKAKW